jgi:hypothetical protein
MRFAPLLQDVGALRVIFGIAGGRVAPIGE